MTKDTYLTYHQPYLNVVCPVCSSPNGVLNQIFSLNGQSMRRCTNCGCYHLIGDEVYICRHAKSGLFLVQEHDDYYAPRHGLSKTR